MQSPTQNPPFSVTWQQSTASKSLFDKPGLAKNPNGYHINMSVPPATILTKISHLNERNGKIICCLPD
ncbi:uncharacterized protein PHALS_14550 [Plasmopara halstedii]|uniref:Uncharacterized protein n=1 Tax=Plasmopara halstedii TaxID=4781 RepID=A0A0P1AJY7_PLAHL|nr:uncharacterized protein PHALS_14550 [Plasmopara halstedii]CEG41681.1 hypothetical protein PHALS_14550 [Plasmopara halstedii]|eukprot:XP_024578050.1 hypothetical protein PHALS_14550 [Plasmopara halstedii]